MLCFDGAALPSADFRYVCPTLSNIILKLCFRRQAHCWQNLFQLGKFHQKLSKHFIGTTTEKESLLLFVVFSVFVSTMWWPFPCFPNTSIHQKAYLLWDSFIITLKGPIITKHVINDASAGVGSEIGRSRTLLAALIFVISLMFDIIW